MEKELQKIKKDWAWLYKDGKLDEETVLREIYDYDFILKEVGKVYCEISKGKLSKPNYKADILISELEENFWDKEIVIEYIKEIIKESKTLKELKEKLNDYLKN